MQLPLTLEVIVNSLRRNIATDRDWSSVKHIRVRGLWPGGHVRGRRPGGVTKKSRLFRRLARNPRRWGKRRKRHANEGLDAAM